MGVICSSTIDSWNFELRKSHKFSLSPMRIVIPMDCGLGFSSWRGWHLVSRYKLVTLSVRSTISSASRKEVPDLDILVDRSFGQELKKEPEFFFFLKNDDVVFVKRILAKPTVIDISPKYPPFGCFSVQNIP